MLYELQLIWHVVLTLDHDGTWRAQEQLYDTAKAAGEACTRLAALEADGKRCYRAVYWRAVNLAHAKAELPT